jgi:manganese/zinc/iron transport system permease protein
MAALLITPAASARYWTHRLGVMLALAGLFGALAGFLGTAISYLQPKMPTGPWVVIALALVTVLSILFGSHKGVLARYFQGRRNHKKILVENILKCLYHLGESNQDFGLYYSEAAIQQRRFIPKNTLKVGISLLTRKHLLAKKNENVALTEEGIVEAKRIIRIHRLWELYLTTHLSLPIDHVHEDAEAIEHIITPELEQELALRLNHPAEDPHHTAIPYTV